MHRELPPFPNAKQLRGLAGFLIVCSGITLLLDQSFQTGWLSTLAIPLVGFSSLIEGLRTKKHFFSWLGIILVGIGVATLLITNAYFTALTLIAKIGLGLIAFAIIMGLLIPFSLFTSRKTYWWVLVPSFLVFSLGACLLLTSLHILDFALFLLTALGMALVLWSVFTKNPGLLISGSIILPLGIGLYAAWFPSPNIFAVQHYNGLTQTAVMLFFFSLGWFIITPLYQYMRNQFVWWPFVPGGILALCALGLYIGGNPLGFLSFFGNILFIPLILYGFYLFREIRQKRLGHVITGIALGGLGISAFIGFNDLLDLSWQFKLFCALLFYALCWFVVIATPLLFQQKPYWWATIPAFCLSGTALAVFFSEGAFLDYVICITAGLGAALISWGIIIRLFALIIPGSIILTIGPGVFFAWRHFEGITETSNGLTQTGIMLVWFAFGWILISILSRIFSEKMVWWPLIPGGIQAMVGYGLYIGGSTSTALSFLRNTGSIALIIFGIYLLLIRRSVKQ